MTVASAVLAALFGLAMGSFLNVVIVRVPAGKSVVHPPSACPACSTPISRRDNIPVVSWALLGGRCRSCRTVIPWRYPAVEGLTAALFVAIVVRLGASWSLLVELPLVTGLVALAFVDAERMLLPKRIVWPTAVLVAAGAVAAAGLDGSWRRLAVAAITAAVSFSFFYLLHALAPGGIGFGDVRLSPVIGLGLGWLGWRYAFDGFLLASLLGVVVGVVLVATGRQHRRQPLPFGVFLAAGAVLAILIGTPGAYP